MFFRDSFTITTLKSGIGGAALAMGLASTAIATPLNFPSSVDPLVTTGAEAACTDTIIVSNTAASCGGTESYVAASAILETGQIKVRAQKFDSNVLPVPGFPSVISRQAYASSGFVDLITVTEGFDQDGHASGTFELEIEGAVSIAPDQLGAASTGNFAITSWSTDEPTPPCFYDTDDCGFFPAAATYPYRYAEVWFDNDYFNEPEVFQVNTFEEGEASTVTLLSVIESDLRVRLSVSWTVTEDQPSFFIAALGSVSAEFGLSDFYNTATAEITGPDGFAFTAEKGFGAVKYAVDDGSAEASLGLGTGAGDSFFWANQFTAPPGGDTITEIHIAFGDPINPPGAGEENGAAVTVSLWNDVNNDGSPDDAVLLASTVGVIASSDTDTFESFDIPDTAVNGSFFVAASFIDDQGSLLYPAALDQTCDAGNSWLGTGSTDISVSASPNSGSIYAGNWLIRAASDGADWTNTCVNDADGDAIVDANDNCPLVPNTDQADFNEDNLGDACQDSDADGVNDADDNCLSIANPGQEPSAINPECGRACVTSSCVGPRCVNH